MAEDTLGPALLADIHGMIEEARAAVAATVNAGLTLLYWRIGTRINDEVLQGERAEYGRETILALERQLEAEFGRGFSEKSLRHMVRFAEAFSDVQIVSSLLRQSSARRRLAPGDHPVRGQEAGADRAVGA